LQVPSLSFSESDLYEELRRVGGIVQTLVEALPDNQKNELKAAKTLKNITHPAHTVFNFVDINGNAIPNPVTFAGNQLMNAADVAGYPCDHAGQNSNDPDLNAQHPVGSLAWGLETGAVAVNAFADLVAVIE